MALQWVRGGASRTGGHTGAGSSPEDRYFLSCCSTGSDRLQGGLSAPPAVQSRLGALRRDCVTEHFSSLPLGFMFFGCLCAKGRGVERYN